MSISENLFSRPTRKLANDTVIPLSPDTLISFRLTSLLWMAGITLLMVPIATLFDVPIARWFAGQPLPKYVGRILDLSVYYSQGHGVFLMLTAVILLMPRRRWCVPRLATLAMGAGAVATLAKMVVLRPRPNSLYLDASSYDYAWIWSFDWTLSQVATFDAGTRAFPSASLATATALTVGLWAVQPKGRWLFVALCVGTMIQRTFCGAHFPSDLFGSASVGLAWAYVCFHPSLMGSVFDKMEPGREARKRREFSRQREPVKRVKRVKRRSVDELGSASTAEVAAETPSDSETLSQPETQPEIQPQSKPRKAA